MPSSSRHPPPPSACAADAPRKRSIHTPIRIGKFLVSPLTKRLADGRYAASVSIRSGAGSATHDRVLRLLPLFDTAEAAARHGAGEGAAWIGAHRPAT